MKKSLRKGTFHLHATYKDGNFSNNLMAEGLTIEVAGNTVILEMDVGCSLRVRSKESNTYEDAIQLSDERAQLRFVQLDTELVHSAIAQAISNVTDPGFHLAIKLGQYGRLVYEVNPGLSGGNVQLNVINLVAQT